MRLCFDMDGTITEGRFLPAPRTRADYMGLAPYDNDTIDVLEDILHKHEVYIISARSEPRADLMIQDWLTQYNIHPVHPTAIITNPVVGRKNPANAIWKWKLLNLLACDIVFDDSPNVYRECLSTHNIYLMNNTNWKENQDLLSLTRRLGSWRQVNEIIHNSEPHASQTTV